MGSSVGALMVLMGMLAVSMADPEQPLSRIAIENAVIEMHEEAYVTVSPTVLGLKGQSKEWVVVEYSHPKPSQDDWIGVFSPPTFNASFCEPPNGEHGPRLCTAPIKFQFANFSNKDYTQIGRGLLKIQLINQRASFSFALFSGGTSNPKLVSVSNIVSFANPKAPVYPRLAQGKSWNEMTVTWTSGYDIAEAEPLVEWGRKGRAMQQSPAGTLTFTRESLCGPPAKTIGWRDPGYIHTGFLRELWPNSLYTYKVGHRLLNDSYVWSRTYNFKASPYPGQQSVQHIVLFGDLGKAEPDGFNEFSDFQRASLVTIYQLTEELDNIDMIIHIGDICYANGYLSQWDQFTAQIEPLASTVPYMIGSGNHERDWPDSGSFYRNMDSGGECGVLAQTMFYVPAENRAKLWYSTDYGMFRFCIADTELDWRPGTEQYQFIEHCFASVDREKQPWLVFLAHRVLGYSSGYFYADQGSFAEPMGRESLQELWQKYKVDIALYGHVHNYERTCPIYENICTNQELSDYRGPLNGTIHVVAGGAGASLAEFTSLKTKWSIFKDFDYGFAKLTAFNHSSLLFEYKKSSDGEVYDYFTITRGYRDILACTFDSCPRTTLAS